MHLKIKHDHSCMVFWQHESILLLQMNMFGLGQDNLALIKLINLGRLLYIWVGWIYPTLDVEWCLLISALTVTSDRNYKLIHITRFCFSEDYADPTHLY